MLPSVKKLVMYVIYTFLIIGLVACSDLEENLVGEITEEIEIEGTPFETDPDILGSPYATLRYTGTANHGSYYSIQEITSDEMFVGAKGRDWSSSEGLIHLHRHTYTPFNPHISNAFQSCYQAINTINDYLEFPFLNENHIAQSKALRAYFYWRLLDLFGRVKLLTENNPDPPQASRTEVFSFVEQELLAALGISSLSPSPDLSDCPLAEGGSAYVINRYGALGLLARLYLNAEVYTGVPMYDKAEIAASLIINSGRYWLCGEGCSVANLGRRSGVESDPERLEGYAAVFAPNNEDNPEHIFSVMYDELTGGGMNFSQMNLHYTSQLSWHLDQQPWNGYATLEEFYNSYEEEDIRKKASFLVGPQLGFDGSAILDYQTDDDNVQLNYTPEVNELTPNCLREAGARPAKFSFKLFGRVDMDNDFPILRLGEMYLIRGEARARQSGNWADAEQDVNIIRARAGVASYNVTLTEEEFLAERGREMFQETARRTDLIRFGRYNEAWWEKPVSEPFRNIFPIPALFGLGTGWTQNPGY